MTSRLLSHQIEHPVAFTAVKSLQAGAFGVIIHKTFLAWIFHAAWDSADRKKKTCAKRSFSVGFLIIYAVSLFTCR